MSEPFQWVDLDGRGALILGDMLDLVPQAVERFGRPAHVLTDPPYEAIMHASKSKRRPGLRRDGGGDLRSLDFEAIDDIRDRSARLMIENCDGWLGLFSTPEGVAPWRDAIEAAGAKYKLAGVWVKPDAAPKFNGQGPAAGAEMIVFAWCGGGFSRWNAGGARGVWTFPTNPPDRDGAHPTEKPVRLMMKLILDFTAPGDLILDPFAGSGSTGVAALKTGRRFVGIERDEKYFGAAIRRLSAAVDDPVDPLFAEGKWRQKGLSL